MWEELGISGGTAIIEQFKLLGKKFILYIIPCMAIKGYFCIDKGKYKY